MGKKIIMYITTHNATVASTMGHKHRQTGGTQLHLEESKETRDSVPRTQVVCDLRLEDWTEICHVGRERESGKWKKNIPDEGRSRARYTVCHLQVVQGHWAISHKATKPRLSSHTIISFKWKRGKNKHNKTYPRKSLYWPRHKQSWSWRQNVMAYLPQQAFSFRVCSPAIPNIYDSPFNMSPYHYSSTWYMPLWARPIIHTIQYSVSDIPLGDSEQGTWQTWYTMSTFDSKY